MVRFTVMAALMLAGVVTVAAQGTDRGKSDTKGKQDAEKGKTDPPKGQLPKQEKPAPDDGFVEGAVFSGTLLHYSLDNKGKMVAKGHSIALSITRRSGNDFSATVSGAYEVEGTVGGSVKWKVTRSLAEHTKGQVGVKTFTGTLRFDMEKGEWLLKGTSTMIGERYAGQWELRSKKGK